MNVYTYQIKNKQLKNIQKDNSQKTQILLKIKQNIYCQIKWKNVDQTSNQHFYDIKNNQAQTSSSFQDQQQQLNSSEQSFIYEIFKNKSTQVDLIYNNKQNKFTIKKYVQSKKEFKNQIQILKKIEGHNISLSLIDFSKGEQMMIEQVAGQKDFLEISKNIFQEKSKEESISFVDNFLQITFIKLFGKLESLHKLGIAHGDIKPQNIVLGYDNEPYFIGFTAAVQFSNCENYLDNWTPIFNLKFFQFTKDEKQFNSSMIINCDKNQLVLSFLYMIALNNKEKELIKEQNFKKFFEIKNENFSKFQRFPSRFLKILEIFLSADPYEYYRHEFILNEIKNEQLTISCRVLKDQLNFLQDFEVKSQQNTEIIVKRITQTNIKLILLLDKIFGNLIIDAKSTLFQFNFDSQEFIILCYKYPQIKQYIQNINEYDMKSNHEDFIKSNMIINKLNYNQRFKNMNIYIESPPTFIDIIKIYLNQFQDQTIIQLKILSRNIKDCYKLIKNQNQLSIKLIHSDEDCQNIVFMGKCYLINQNENIYICFKNFGQSMKYEQKIVKQMLKSNEEIQCIFNLWIQGIYHQFISNVYCDMIKLLKEQNLYKKIFINQQYSQINTVKQNEDKLLLENELILNHVYQTQDYKKGKFIYELKHFCFQNIDIFKYINLYTSNHFQYEFILIECEYHQSFFEDLILYFKGFSNNSFQIFYKQIDESYQNSEIMFKFEFIESDYDEINQNQIVIKILTNSLNNIYQINQNFEIDIKQDEDMKEDKNIFYSLENIYQFLKPINFDQVLQKQSFELIQNYLQNEINFDENKKKDLLLQFKNTTELFGQNYVYLQIFNIIIEHKVEYLKDCNCQNSYHVFHHLVLVDNKINYDKLTYHEIPNTKKRKGLYKEDKY